MRRLLILLLLLAAPAFAQRGGTTSSQTGVWPVCTSGDEAKIANLSGGCPTQNYFCLHSNDDTYKCNNSVWAKVATPTGGGGSALDFQIGGTSQTSALDQINVTGDTNSIFSESPADGMLIAIGNNWPTCDSADGVAADAVALSTDTTGNYVATVTDAGSSTITVIGSGSEGAAITLDAVDLNCTGCLTATELAAGSVQTGEILDDTITPNDLAAAMVFADGDLLDLSAVDLSSASEGIYLPQSTSCAFAIADGQLCWDNDNDILYAGDGAALVNINGSGSGDITDVFDCTSGNCQNIAASDGDLLDFSAVSVSAANEGLFLPGHATDCSAAGTAEGQVCWEHDADLLYIGDGATVKVLGGGAVNAIRGDLDTDTTGATVSIDGAAGIDTAVSGDVLTITPDFTELNTITFGNGSATAYTWNAGVTDPVFTFASDSLTLSDMATLSAASTAATFQTVTTGGASTASVDFNDSDDTGDVDGSIDVNCPNPNDCDMVFSVDSGSDTEVEAFRIDTSDAGTTTIIAAAAITASGGVTGALTGNASTATALADGDNGDFTTSSGTATLDVDVVAAAEMADADHGDVAWSSGVATVENLQCTGCVAAAEIVTSPALDGGNFTSIPAGAFNAAAVDGDDIASSIGGRSLTLEGGTPDQIDADAELYTDTETIVIQAPATGDSGDVDWICSGDAGGCTITKVWCSTDTGTATINFEERVETTPNTAGTDVLSAGLVCDSGSQSSCASGCDVNTISNAAIDQYDPVNLQVDAVASTPGVVRIHVKYTRDDS